MGYVELVFRREGRFLRLCARKRLHEQFRTDVSFRSMFMDEGRLAGLVHHPNAVGVMDVGEDDEGPFLIMDFVEGVSLSKLIAEAVGAGRSVPMQVAVRICMDAAQGLHAAHEVRAEDGTVLRLVHRDVSPQNILIGFDGTVRVSDFGIAKALGNASRTSVGVLKGNMGYLAPEQLRFEEPDRRSDFFSLGVTLYELLSGLRLYPNKTGFDGTRRILTEPPPDIGEIRNDVPPELCELLFELLAKDRDSRPATAVEIAARLEGILAVLIAEEGSVTVGDYMGQHFAAHCQEQRARLSAHLKRIQSQTVTTLRSIPALSQPTATSDAPADGRRTRAVRTLILGLTVSAAVAGSIGFWARGSTQTASPASPVSHAPSAPFRMVAPSVPAPAPSPVVAAEAPAAAGEAQEPMRAAKPAARSPRPSAGLKEHRRLAKRSIRRVRTVEVSASAGARGNGADSTPNANHSLAVPLFERWQ